MKITEFLDSINWPGVERVHVSNDGKFYSFAVEVDPKKKAKRLLTIGLGPQSTTMTIADMKGNILTHAIQQGDEITFFSPKAK